MSWRNKEQFRRHAPVFDSTCSALYASSLAHGVSISWGLRNVQRIWEVLHTRCILALRWTGGFPAARIRPLKSGQRCCARSSGRRDCDFVRILALFLQAARRRRNPQARTPALRNAGVPPHVPDKFKNNVQIRTVISGPCQLAESGSLGFKK